jgi:hypothetical protein
VTFAGCSSKAAKDTATPHTAPGATGTTSPPTTVREVNPSGDIPDNAAFVEFRSPTGGFALRHPEGFAESTNGSAVTFTDKLNTIRVETVAASAAPTVASAQSAELPAIQSAAGFKAGKVTTVSRKAGPGVLLTYEADAPPDTVTGKVVHDEVERYEFWRTGTEVIITLSSPKGSDNVDPWRIVTDSFRWL